MINWKNIPFIRLVLALIAGILIGIYSNVFLHFWLTISIISYATLVLVFIFINQKISNWKEQLFGWTLQFCILIFGISLIAFKTANNSISHYSNFQTDNSKFLIKVTEVPKNKPNSIQVIGEVLKVYNGSSSNISSGNVLLYFQKDSSSATILQGDQILLQCQFNEIQRARNPDQFNYKQYLRFNQIYHQGFVSNSNWKKKESGSWSITNIASNLRDQLLKTLESNGLKGNELSVASALILGYKDDLDTDLKHSYSSAGATHVLAVSGLHVGIIFLVISTLLSFLNKNQTLRVIKLSLILIILWFYALITGLSPSVVRAATMFSFVAAGDIFDRKSSIYNTLAASAFVLLCYNPFLIMEVGFQLSYLAVLGIVYFQPKIYKKVYCSNWILDKIWGITAVSIAAQLTTFPLGLLYFHQFPTYFMISNLFVIPGAFIIILVGIVLFATSVLPIISTLIAKLLFVLIYAMNWLVESIDQLPFSLIEGISITILECWLLYISLLLIVSSLEFNKLKYLNLAIICITTLLVIDYNEDRYLETYQEVCIYDIKNEPNINVISKNFNNFYSSPQLFNDYSSMLFNVRHHWDDLDAVRAHHLPLNQTLTLEFKGLNLTIIPATDSLKSIENSQIIYTESSFLPEISNCNTIIVGHLVNYKTRKKIKNYAISKNIKCHQLRKDGAFVLNYLNANQYLKLGMD